jgi:hypothetical protein
MRATLRDSDEHKKLGGLGSPPISRTTNIDSLLLGRLWSGGRVGSRAGHEFAKLLEGFVGLAGGFIEIGELDSDGSGDGGVFDVGEELGEVVDGGVVAAGFEDVAGGEDGGDAGAGGVLCDFAVAVDEFEIASEHLGMAHALGDGGRRAHSRSTGAFTATGASPGRSVLAGAAAWASGTTGGRAFAAFSALVVAASFGARGFLCEGGRSNEKGKDCGEIVAGHTDSWVVEVEEELATSSQLGTN